MDTPYHHTHSQNTDTHKFNSRPILVYTLKLCSAVFYHGTFVFFPERKRVSLAYSLRFFYLYKAWCTLVSLVKDAVINMQISKKINKLNISSGKC